MVEKLRSEAAAHHARVELKVKRLECADAGAAEPAARAHPGRLPHRHRRPPLCFSKIARQLDGEARFYLDPERPIASSPSKDASTGDDRSTLCNPRVIGPRS